MPSQLRPAVPHPSVALGCTCTAFPLFQFGPTAQPFSQPFSCAQCLNPAPIPKEALWVGDGSAYPAAVPRSLPATGEPSCDGCHWLLLEVQWHLWDLVKDADTCAVCCLWYKPISALTTCFCLHAFLQNRNLFFTINFPLVHRTS